MTTSLEQSTCRLLRIFLASRTDFDSDEWLDYSAGMERLIPALFSDGFDWWKRERFDVTRVAALSSASDETLEYRAVAYGIASKAWIPIWVRASIRQDDSEFSRLWIRAGTRNGLEDEMELLSEGGSRLAAVESLLMESPEELDWVYEFERQVS